MRTTIILILLAAFLIPARAAVRPHLLVETNGALVAPSAFFTANQSAITALSSGVYQPLDSDLTAFAGISGVSGDIIYHNGSTWVRLPKGTDGQSLQLSSGFPTWATVVGGGGVGDVTLAGTNAFTGPNSFAGVTTLDGSVYINGATTISNQLTFKATGGSGDARLKWTGNKMLLANDTEISSLRTAGSDVAFGTFFAGPVQSYAVRADGMISWSDGTNAASAVFGPRRIEDRMNGVVRLSGGLGITERSAPPTPENNTGTIWLESATTKSIKVSWPDGTSSAIGSGGGGDVTLAGTNLFTGPNTFGGATVVSNLTVPGTLAVGSISSSSPIGMSIGGTGGTNAESARASLGVKYDVDVQAYRLGLLQAALALTADGHMLVHNGSLVTNLTSTAAGRALLTAASASAQWNNYLLSVASTNGAYDATSWNGVTDRLVTLDQFRDAINALPGGSNAITSVTSPLVLSNGVLSLDTNGLYSSSSGSGGSGFTYLISDAIGSWYGRDTTTNWPIISTTISSNDLPSATGRFIEGAYATVVSNYSGTTADIVINVSFDGTTVFRDSYSQSSFSASKAYVGRFYIVRESASTASFILLGGHANATAPSVGIGDIGTTLQGMTAIATNVAVNWSSNIAFTLEFQSATSTSTNAALGMRRSHAWMRRESTTPAVTGPASSTNAAIAIWNGTGGTNIADSGVLLSDLQTHDTDLDDLADGSLSGSKIGSGINADNVTTGTLASNRLPSAISLTTLSAGTLTATSVSGDGSGLTNLNGSNISSGTVAAARIDSAIARTNAPTLHSPTLLTPTLASPTLNGTATFEQTVLSAHSSVTNFVADPTVSAKQTINADLASSFATVGFLHATNVAAGRETTILVFAGTNASVTVSLAAQFARNTNSVSLTTGQILPISFYGYGSNPTNVIATMGTVYTR